MLRLYLWGYKWAIFLILYPTMHKIIMLRYLKFKQSYYNSQILFKFSGFSILTDYCKVIEDWKAESRNCKGSKICTFRSRPIENDTLPTNTSSEKEGTCLTIFAENPVDWCTWDVWTVLFETILTVDKITDYYMYCDFACNPEVLSFGLNFSILCSCIMLHIWAPSNEFVSSSIPSWQTLTAHAQPFRGARDLAVCLKVPLDSLLVWASSGGSGETARMSRLAWTFAARIGDKYQIRLTRSICRLPIQILRSKFLRPFFFISCIPVKIRKIMKKYW